ncbi:ABC transporter ATP-binding protein [Segnochrobactrum spirostomi]|uniref:ABC transporter ATP-binding protein n=1 Tax=Segnochrobactrum spirostomi TaxID=2608987 RepID=A0A6A7Y9I1_9HYPH|nr:ATP-binding cassette domain-containing protein [Segnochrobactrum spirostomi]MQT14631.1 ABC transporter ATP-binding protein [Segnochrobactrum spirostomi]
MTTSVISAGSGVAGSAPLLALDDLWFRHRRGTAPWALSGVGLSLDRGETLALVGESGSGKSTLARLVAGLIVPERGRIRFEGRDIAGSAARRSASARRQIQIVFQNPDASLNPRHRIATILARPLRRFFGLRGELLRVRIEALLADVQLPRDYAERFPSELSGGERQRVAIARALAAEPSILLCDEITSALDVSVQASILDLLKGIQAGTGLSILFITHDLAVTRWFADRVAVLYRGALCESGPVDEIFSPPHHPYTAVLIDAVRGAPEPTADGRPAPAPRLSRSA